MNKLYIKRFGVGGDPADNFYVTVLYEPNYDGSGNCISVTVTIHGSVAMRAVEDLYGNDVSEYWAPYGFPTGELEKTFYSNQVEELVCYSRYSGSSTAYVEVTQIGSSSGGGGDDPTPTEPTGPIYQLYNGLIYQYNTPFPLTNIAIEGKQIAEIWYNGTMVWGWKEVDPATLPFNFTIDEVVYTADPGMTWQEWLNSSYGSSSPYEIWDNYVENYRGNRVYRMNPTIEWALGTSEIARNGEYYCNM